MNRSLKCKYLFTVALIALVSPHVWGQGYCLNLYKIYSATPAATGTPNPDQIAPNGGLPLNFKASHGEQETLSVDLLDNDQYTYNTGGAPIPFESTYSEWTHHWSITGKANFSSTGSLKTKTDAAVGYSEVKVYIQTDFGAADSITVTDSAVDSGITITAPDQGNTKDTTVTTSWTISYKAKCPTGLTITGPANPAAAQTLPPGGTWTYKGASDAAPAYEGDSVGETFGTTSSNIDATFINAAGLAAHPGVSAAQWKDYFFGPGQTSIFVLDSTDSFSDLHNGALIGDVSYLKVPLPNDLTCDLPQTYTCNSDAANLSQSYTIHYVYAKAAPTTGTVTKN